MRHFEYYAPHNASLPVTKNINAMNTKGLIGTKATGHDTGSGCSRQALYHVAYVIVGPNFLFALLKVVFPCIVLLQFLKIIVTYT